ncbi:MAG: dihydroorotate dehydrogenase electron transfer subunit [Candidatus Omnitrophota bacterium]
MGKVQNKYQIVSNEKVCPRFYRLRFAAPALARKIRPGQFIHVKVDAGLEPFFRRPFSVYRALKDVEILYEAVGQGTEILAQRKKGSYLDILGPLGHPFSLPPRGTRQVVMIAGGIGVAPFQILSDFLKGRGLQLVLLYGGRTKEHVFDMKEFKKNGCEVYITTEDGSAGVKGRVSKLFGRISKDPRTTMVYTCGPKPMMAAVQEFARRQQLSGEMAGEEVMACGLGACLGCSIKTVSGYKTVCHDGPVFKLNEVIF